MERSGLGCEFFLPCKIFIIVEEQQVAGIFPPFSADFTVAKVLNFGAFGLLLRAVSDQTTTPQEVTPLGILKSHKKVHA